MIPDQTYVLGATKILVAIPVVTQTDACGDTLAYSLNDIASFVQIEGTNIALFGSDLTQAGTINVIVTIKASSPSIAVLTLPFTITALNCKPAGLTATPATLTVTQLQAPATITLSQTQAPDQCGSYTNTI